MRFVICFLILGFCTIGSAATKLTFYGKVKGYDKKQIIMDHKISTYYLSRKHIGAHQIPKKLKVGDYINLTVPFEAIRQVNTASRYLIPEKLCIDREDINC